MGCKAHDQDDVMFHVEHVKGDRTMATATVTPTTNGTKAEEMAAELARLQAENERLRQTAATARRMTLKVGDKGGVSLYGIGRFPVTLYREQWERLLAHADDIRAFIRDNAALLKVKGS